MSSLKNFIKLRKQKIVAPQEETQACPKETKWKVDDEIVINAPTTVCPPQEEDDEDFIIDAAKNHKNFDWTKRSTNTETSVLENLPIPPPKVSVLDELQQFVGISPGATTKTRDNYLHLDDVAAMVIKESNSGGKKRSNNKQHKVDVLNQLLQSNEQQNKLRTAEDIWRIVGAWNTFGTSSPKFDICA